MFEKEVVKIMPLLHKAMAAPESLVIRTMYVDDEGVITKRYISPIRIIDKEHLLALCLCREEPRSFVLNRLIGVELVSADDVLMPMEIEVIEVD